MVRLLTYLLASCVIWKCCIVSADLCYGELGCFSQHHPWVSLERPLPPPEHPENISTSFRLYTRRNPAEAVIILPGINLDLRGTSFDAQKTTVFIVHGYRSSADEDWLHDMKNAFLTLEDANVFLVDWRKGCQGGRYDLATANTRVVGAEMARLGNYLKRLGASTKRFHLIGHSLGAHTAAYMAKRIPGIGRLTGLDPAKPFFEGENKKVRLDKEDALFVEVVHTDAGPTIPLLGLGMFSAIGDVDFYMNGGLEQPGCGPKPEALLQAHSIVTAVEALFESIPCPHYRAYLYYVEAIANPNCTFWGHRRSPLLSAASTVIQEGLTEELADDIPCDLDVCVPLGLRAVEFPARGAFEVATTSASPYCMKEETSDAVMEEALTSHSKISPQFFKHQTGWITPP